MKSSSEFVVVREQFAEEKLPDKLSELMELAFKDLLHCVELGYEVDMGSWYVENPKADRCSVCLAGAVLARVCHFSHGIDVRYEMQPRDLDEDSCNKLNAIDSARSGNLCYACHYLGIDCPTNLAGMVMDTIHEDWQEEIPKRIAFLKENGL